MQGILHIISIALSFMMRILMCCLIPYLYDWIIQLPRYKGKYRWKTQTICKLVIETITGVSFHSVRPNWLKNPQTGKNMELDCFNPTMAIALEYNGKQHYVYTPCFHTGTEPNNTHTSGMRKFELQVYRDELKKSLCDKEGISLIIVPYTIPTYEISSYILQKLILVKKGRYI